MGMDFSATIGVGVKIYDEQDWEADNPSWLEDEDSVWDWFEESGLDKIFDLEYGGTPDSSIYYLMLRSTVTTAWGWTHKTIDLASLECSAEQSYVAAEALMKHGIKWEPQVWMFPYYSY